MRKEDTEATQGTEESAAVGQAGQEVVSQQGSEAGSAEAAQGEEEEEEVLPLERHALRAKAAIELRVLLAAITINVRTLNSLRRVKALVNAA